MDGNNRDFMANVPVYLRKDGYPLRVPPRGAFNDDVLDQMVIDAAGTGFFDLRKSPHGVWLVPWVARAVQPKFGTPHPIHAFWLNYLPGRTFRVNIGGLRARFLFTPMLDGCYIAVRNNQICHISGRDAHDVDRTLAAMQLIANQQLGGAPAIAFNSGAANATSMTLVGAATVAGVWSWYVQGHGMFGGMVPPTLEPVFAVNNLNALAADRGQNVIQLIGLHYQ